MSTFRSEEPEIRDIAVIGAAGACGRQVVIQLLNRSLMAADTRLQLVSRKGGSSADMMHGLRADLRDAFADDAPTIELVDEPSAVDADLVVMMAGATLSSGANRAELAAKNRQMFQSYADALAEQGGTPPLVIVQSNPVELGVSVFSRRLERHRVVGAGAWSDTLRFRREIADALGVRRTEVQAGMIGQHGDHLVPIWSRVRVSGTDQTRVDQWIAAQRAGRALADLPEEIVRHRTRLLEMVSSGNIGGAFVAVESLPADLRAIIKPFLIHFTAGHTTEITTAHSVVDLIALAMEGDDIQRPLQVRLENEIAGVEGVIGLPVLFGPAGWHFKSPPEIAQDELDALHICLDAIAQANTTQP